MPEWFVLVLMAVCAWFSFKSGERSGIITGVNMSLEMLKDSGFIDVTEDGEIRRVKDVPGS